MTWFWIAISRLGSFLSRPQSDEELDEELRAHIEMLTDEYVSKGMSTRDARRAARREFGGVDQTKEEYREQRGLPMIETLLQDIRYAFRVLIKNPGFTIVAIFALALGIGANTAIFSIVNAVLLRSLPYSEPDRLYTLWERNTKIREPYEQNPPALGNLADWRNQNHVFEGIASFFPNMDMSLAGSDSPEHVTGALVSANVFSILRVDPIRGRAFRSEEEELGKNKVAIISHGLWMRRFGYDPNVIGKSILIDGTDFQVIGVMPQGFNFPGGTGTVLGVFTSRPSDVWIPLAFPPAALAARSSHSVQAIARLRPNVSIEQAQAEMRTIQGQIEKDHPNDYVGTDVNMIPLKTQISGSVRPVLLVLLGVVAFVLLIACVNVANLLLARATSRRKEIAIRSSLGASRARVLRQLLTESLLLAATGGIVGVVLGGFGLRALKTMLPENFPRAQEIGIDFRVLGFTLLISLATGVIFGLAPAVQASKLTFTEALKEGGRGSTEGLRHNRLRSLLVVTEIGLSLILLVGAGLMIQSFTSLQRVNAGFSPDHVLTMSLKLPRATYRDNVARASFFQRLIEQTKAIPGVLLASATTQIPLGGDNMSYAASVEGRVYPPDFFPNADVRCVTSDYFNTMKIPLIKGRLFNETDTADTTPVLLINETMARRTFLNEDPIGKRMTLGFGNYKGEIVGVVGNVKEMGLATEANETVFCTYAQSAIWTNMILTVRTAGNPMMIAGALRSTLAAIDKNQSITELKTMDSVVADSVSQPRFRTMLLGLFAAVALLLAMVGIYGVMSYSANQRTHEIGIRMALGAQKTDVLRLIVGQGALLAVIGVCVGLIGSLLLTRLLSEFLYNVRATDPATFAGTALILLVVALLSCYIPARRAARVDPMIALRYE